VGIAQAFRSGIITQTSAMAPCPWISEAATLVKAFDIPIGVHGTLTCIEELGIELVSVEDL